MKRVGVGSERQLTTANAATRRDVMKKIKSEKTQKKVTLKDLKARKEIKGGYNQQQQ
jgi:hypothetical protein